MSDTPKPRAARDARYRASHSTEMALRCAANYVKNREKRLAYQAAYYQRHKRLFTSGNQ